MEQRSDAIGVDVFMSLLMSLLLVVVVEVVIDFYILLETLHVLVFPLLLSNLLHYILKDKRNATV